MPAKKQITKEQILNKAVEIVKKDGISALNARTLAQKCKCSTQPIYLSFGSIKALKEEVANEVVKIFDRFIEREIASGKYPQYKAVGMGYIRFAKEEKQLFKYILMDGGMLKGKRGDESFNKSVNMIMKNNGLYEGEASKLHLQMWIFVHGIASMFATDYIDWDWEFVSASVSNAYFAFTEKMKGENK